MALSTLPLCYCANVHPSRTVADVESFLDSHTRVVRERYGHPLAAGLWFTRSVVDQLSDDTNRVKALAEHLKRCDLSCHTLNAFPYGDFHSLRVKENVYLPDWSDPARFEYTIRCATVLASLLAEGTDGSISTLPLGFKNFAHPADFRAACVRQLIAVAASLAELHAETGRLIRLAVEPEPFCVLETTSEAIGFFHKLWQAADRRGLGEIVRGHVGLCFDICHQAVEFEDVAASIRAINAAGVRINKVHVSSAIQLNRPATNPDGRDALRRYIDPRYLHQTIGRFANGRLTRAVDLSDNVLTDAGSELWAADTWRVHFHVPVDAERLGPLDTTRPAISEALTAVVALDYAPHLEVETYTWSVLPGEQPADLIDGLTRELVATRTILDGLA